jgi:hypothetical protein
MCELNCVTTYLRARIARRLQWPRVHVNFIFDRQVYMALLPGPQACMRQEAQQYD